MKKEINISKARYDIIPEDKSIHKGKTVLCITTGEVFKSAREAAEHYGINYVSLLTQISGKIKTCGGGIRNVNGNGMKFCYVSEMGYKANDIANYIIELKAKVEMNAASMMKIQEDCNRVVEEESKKKKEMQEMLHKIMTLVG